VLSGEVIVAFLTGIGSVLGAGWTLRRARREEREECDRRIADQREAYDRGLHEGLHMSERDA
jgi:hypothetical protein